VLLGLHHLLRRRHALVLGTATLTAVQVYVLLLLHGQHSWGRVLVVVWHFLFLVALQGGHGGVGLAMVIALMPRRGGCHDRRDTNV
jgi:hypothetical protein